MIEKSHGVSGANDFYVNRMPNLERRLQSAKTIAINGMTLSRTSDSFWELFRECISNHGQVRLMVVDPEHPALEIAASRFHKHQDIERVKREIAHSLDNFGALQIQIDPDSSELFQLRLEPFSPPYGIWMIDVESPTAEIWVELYSFRDEQEPAFQLLPHRDGDRFGQ